MSFELFQKLQQYQNLIIIKKILKILILFKIAEKILAEGKFIYQAVRFKLLRIV